MAQHYAGNSRSSSAIPRSCVASARRSHRMRETSCVLFHSSFMIVLTSSQLTYVISLLTEYGLVEAEDTTHAASSLVRLSSSPEELL